MYKIGNQCVHVTKGHLKTLTSNLFFSLIDTTFWKCNLQWIMADLSRSANYFSISSTNIETCKVAVVLFQKFYNPNYMYMGYGVVIGVVPEDVERMLSFFFWYMLVEEI